MFDIEAGKRTNLGAGGVFNVESGGIVNNLGDFYTLSGSTATLSGLWNEMAGNTHTIFGTFNVASGGIYDNEANRLTKIKSGGNFNLQNGGEVNNFGKYVVLPGGTATLDDDYNNNAGKTRNFGTMNLDCNGSFNALGGTFGGTPIVDICPPP